MKQTIMSPLGLRVDLDILTLPGAGGSRVQGTFLYYGVEFLPQVKAQKTKTGNGFCYGMDAAAYAVRVTAPLKMPKE
jgi:hypothetical protein